MINPGGLFIAISCFLAFYYSIYGEQKEINRKIWHVFLFIPIGIIFIFASLMSLSNVGKALFEFGAGLLGWTWFSIIIQYYKLGRLWNRYSELIKGLLYAIVYIFRILVVVIYGFKIFVIYYGVYNFKIW